MKKLFINQPLLKLVRNFNFDSQKKIFVQLKQTKDILQLRSDEDAQVKLLHSPQDGDLPLLGLLLRRGESGLWLDSVGDKEYLLREGTEGIYKKQEQWV